MTTEHCLHSIDAWQPPDPPMAVLVMLAEEDDRVVMIDLSTHPCGQHIIDDLVAGAELVSAHRLHGLPSLLPQG
jgi:hypothetical protein